MRDDIDEITAIKKPTLSRAMSQDQPFTFASAGLHNLQRVYLSSSVPLFPRSFFPLCFFFFSCLHRLSLPFWSPHPRPPSAAAAYRSASLRSHTATHIRSLVSSLLRPSFLSCTRSPKREVRTQEKRVEKSTVADVWGFLVEKKILSVGEKDGIFFGAPEGRGVFRSKA